MERIRSPRWILLTGLLIPLIGDGPVLAADEEGPLTLEQPGFVILSAALDSTSGYTWQLGPGVGQRSLAWPHGVLTLPDSLPVESLRGVDLVVPCTGDLSGLGHTGSLVFQDGIYNVSEPLFLSDGTIQLYLTAGELLVLNQRVRYTAPVEKGRDPRAGYVFLSGMVLLVVILLRRAALKSRNKN